MIWYLKIQHKKNDLIRIRKWDDVTDTFMSKIVFIGTCRDSIEKLDMVLHDDPIDGIEDYVERSRDNWCDNWYMDILSEEEAFLLLL